MLIENSTPLTTRRSLARTRDRCKWRVFLVVSGLLLIVNVAARGASWAVSRNIPLGVSVTRVAADPHRPWVYAIDRQDSNILFINLTTGTVGKTLYVGQDPSDCDIDSSGNFLYVANKGSGTGLPGSWRIGVIALSNQTLVTSYITSVVAEHVTAGRAGILYYNAGYLWNSGDAHALDTTTGTDWGTFAIVKTRMVILSNKSRLFGQYTYTGNLGAMGDFDVSTNPITLVDSIEYSIYPYGWDYDNYSLSGNDQYLAYGQILFNSTNFMDQIGLFQEQVYALNYDASIAFGQTGIWDTTTFPIHGDATMITNMPFASTIMTFDSGTNVLYAFNSTNNSLCVIEPSTSNGIPLRWLQQHGLGTNDSVETQDPDHDGYTNLQEWLLGSDPTNSASPATAFQLQWLAGSHLAVQATSPARWYELQRTYDLVSSPWQPVSVLEGTGSNLVFDVTTDMSQQKKAFYRLRPKVY
jgi:hypothetical protein